jgi:hypothetical protein
MAVEVADVIEFIPHEERRQERLAQSVRAFFNDAARRLGANLDEPLPDDVATRIYTDTVHDEYFDTYLPANVKTLVLTRSRHALTVYGFDTDLGAVSASFDGTEISFKSNYRGITHQGAAALARAEEVFGRAK